LFVVKASNRRLGENDIRRKLAEGSDVFVTFTVAQSDQQAAISVFTVSDSLEAAATAAQSSGALSGLSFESSQIVANTICGNHVCEAGERCQSINDNACCAQDCPFVLRTCPAPKGVECSGHGACLRASGACDCFEQQGYTGTACDECTTNFQLVGDSCVARASGPPPTPSGDAAMATSMKGPQPQNNEGSKDAAVPTDTIIIAACVFACVVVAAIVLVKVRQQRRPLSSGNSGQPSAGHWQMYFRSMRNRAQRLVTNPMAGQRNGAWIHQKTNLPGSQRSHSLKTLVDVHTPDDQNQDSVPVAQPVTVVQNPVDMAKHPTMENETVDTECMI
jgi:hypothetical protein